MTVAWFLVAWVVLSVPVALLVGRLLRRAGGVS